MYFWQDTRQFSEPAWEAQVAGTKRWFFGTALDFATKYDAALRTAHHARHTQGQSIKKRCKEEVMLESEDPAKILQCDAQPGEDLSHFLFTTSTATSIHGLDVMQARLCTSRRPGSMRRATGCVCVCARMRMCVCARVCACHPSVRRVCKCVCVHVRVCANEFARTRTRHACVHAPTLALPCLWQPSAA